MAQDGIEIRIFFNGGAGTKDAAIEGSHSRIFPCLPTVGQSIVFGRPTGDIAVFRVVETGFFVWAEGASAWMLVDPVAGEHQVPAAFFDPIAGEF
ncbi:hypothetical protein ACFB49_18450 [Sphingomonas sp. DBB INV C78]|uniref:hypothetical protein n=1 Tax=Sphingomonas sp. DBB INV C78 TaxID=3349434 RepID=UPI0036D308EA